MLAASTRLSASRAASRLRVCNRPGAPSHLSGSSPVKAPCIPVKPKKSPSMMSGAVRARWLASVLASLLASLPASVSASEARVRPECPTDELAYTLCEYLGSTEDSGTYHDRFMIDGSVRVLSSLPGESFRVTCGGAAPAAWPRFPRAASFASVTLRHCAPRDGESYASALELINVTDVRSLTLVSPSPAAAALSVLPASLTALTLRALGERLVLAPRALAALGVRSLVLDNVRADALPPRLASLVLFETGVKVLPPEAYNVEELSIRERKLTEIFGSVPRLRTLKLWEARALQTLVLKDCNALISAELPLESLRTIDLQRFRASAPTELLGSAPNLRFFTMTESYSVALPPDLFAQNKRLETINLKSNDLQSFPSELFSGLPVLDMLALDNNQLSPGALLPLTTLPALETLLLTGNPLGDLCPEEGASVLSPLQQLRKLVLAGTGATRVCTDWTRALRSLNTLDLSENAVRRLPCAALRVRRKDRARFPLIDLRGNPIDRADCTREDYEQAAADPATDYSSLRVWSSARLRCDCGAYWLARLQRARAALRLTVAYEGDCEDQWFRCNIDEECGVIPPSGQELVYGGRAAKRGEVPWHAGIYARDGGGGVPRQICGGSLVSHTLVISAAHCFWDGAGKRPAAAYAVAVGKLQRAWDDPRDDQAQTSDVSELRLPGRFLGGASSFQADVALVVLARAVRPSALARPACLDLRARHEPEQLARGRRGKVAGWGLSAARGGHPDELQTVDLPFVPTDDCQRDAPAHFRPYITLDKICAGYTDGSAAVCEGDSGGGIAFPRTRYNVTRYYLRGVVSTAPDVDDQCNVNWLTTFTLLSAHRQFIAETWEPLTST